MSKLMRNRLQSIWIPLISRYSESVYFLTVDTPIISKLSKTNACGSGQNVPQHVSIMHTAEIDVMHNLYAKRHGNEKQLRWRRARPNEAISPIVSTKLRVKLYKVNL